MASGSFASTSKVGTYETSPAGGIAEHPENPRSKRGFSGRVLFLQWVRSYALCGHGGSGAGAATSSTRSRPYIGLAA